VNRLLQTVTKASRDFANAAAAIGPLVRQLSSNTTRERDQHFATQASLLEALRAHSHGLPEQAADPRAFTAIHASTAVWSGDDETDSVWSRFAPPRAGLGIPKLTRVGEFSRQIALREGGQGLRVTFPALVPIIGRGGLILLAEGKQLDEAESALQSIAVRLIAALPPGLMRLTLVDHLGVGNSFSLLTPFHEVIRGPMVWHDPRQITSALDALIEQMAMVTQKYLKTRYTDIETYNEDQGVVEEPYRVLAIANFPAGFDANTAKQVISIAQNGPRSGMYVVASIDRKAPLPHGFDLTALTRFCTVLEGTMKADFAWRPNTHGLSDAVGGWIGEVLGSGRVTLDGPPSKKIVENIAAVTELLAADKQSVKVSFDRFVPAELWTTATAEGSVPNTTKDGISVPIGRRGSENQLFELSRGADAVHHALIGGRTGSGKSVLIKGLITSLCMHYSPEELELYLIDFKGGVEFRVFSELRHARVVAIDSEREFGLSVLEGLLAEKSERETKFKKAKANNISEYRKNGEKLPRILLIVDEFQVFFESADRVGTRARGALGDLAKLGRGFGIHVILASQSISASVGGELEAATLNQFGMRIALSMSESDSRRILSKDNDSAKYLTRAGEAIFNAKNGLVEGNVKFQVAHMDDAEVGEHLRTINDRAIREHRGRRPRVFEGNRTASVSDNPTLVRAIREGTRAAQRYVPAYLGEPAQISEEHTFFRMRRQSGDNLLMLGQHEETLFSAFLTAVTSWAVCQPAHTARVFIFNLANVDDPLFEQFSFFARLPQHVRVARNRDVAAILEETAGMLEQRVARSADTATESPVENVLLAFYGFQRARDLVREGMTVKPVTKKLARLLHDGPEHGIASILAADTYGNVMRILEPKELSDFSGRVAVTGSDCGRILGEHATTFKLREHYGVLYELDAPDVLRKFRTYGPEQIPWIEQQLEERSVGHVL
jgi:hypothetical protein